MYFTLGAHLHSDCSHFECLGASSHVASHWTEDKPLPSGPYLSLQPHCVSLCRTHTPDPFLCKLLVKVWERMWQRVESLTPAEAREEIAQH